MTAGETATGETATGGIAAERAGGGGPGRGRLTGKVVVVSGGARGQGRSHAVTFAREGASVVVFDLAESLPGLFYELASEDDLAGTKKLVEQEGGRALALRADVRDPQALAGVVQAALDEFGRIDALCPGIRVADSRAAMPSSASRSSNRCVRSSRPPLNTTAPCRGRTSARPARSREQTAAVAAICVLAFEGVRDDPSGRALGGRSSPGHWRAKGDGGAVPRAAMVRVMIVVMAHGRRM